MKTTVHVFVWTFNSVKAARAYTEPHWELEPGDDASDEEYRGWEKRNPIWPMREDLGVRLDSDFIETLSGATRYKYLEQMLTEDSAISTIKERAPSEANILVLVFGQALDGSPARMASTDVLTYCGEFPCSV